MTSRTEQPAARRTEQRAASRTAGHTGGFTLVEMLVAVLLFGILASIAAALSISATRGFARTDAALAQLSSLEGTRAVLAADLGQAARRPSRTVDGQRLSAFTLLPEGFVLVRRLPAADGIAVEKIAWGFDGSRLLRQTFPAVDGAAPGQAHVMLAGVAALEVTVATTGGWQSRWRPARDTDLPRAVALRLLLRDGTPIELKFPVAT